VPLPNRYGDERGGQHGRIRFRSTIEKGLVQGRIIGQRVHALPFRSSSLRLPAHGQHE